MDGLFKQKLLSLRNPLVPRTFAEALLGDVSWLKRTKVSSASPVPSKTAYSEKIQVIESLERFAQEKATELQTNVLRMDGAEVHLRTDVDWENVSLFSDSDALKNGLGLDSKILDIVLNNKTPQSVKAIFVSEKFRPWNEVESELKSGFINELLVGFPLKTAELFERMIMAMKLIPEEVIIFPVEGLDEADYSKDVMEIAAFYRPEVIITLGAKATHKILKSNDRLSLVHGQFFNRKVGASDNFQVVPLFHPSIIETNQNMKKTAWADMQKIMKHLKKLP